MQSQTLCNAPAQATWQTGDILAFSGRGQVSLTIRLATCSAISHVGCVADVPAWQLKNMASCRVIDVDPERLETWEEQPLLFESTTLAGSACAITNKAIQGVQAHQPEQRIANYEGRVWRYRLTPAWRETFQQADGPRRFYVRAESLALAKQLASEIQRRFDRQAFQTDETHVQDMKRINYQQQPRRDGAWQIVLEYLTRAEE